MGEFDVCIENPVFTFRDLTPPPAPPRRNSIQAIKWCKPLLSNKLYVGYRLNTQNIT